MSLPSYEEATTRPDPWKVIAPMIPITLLGRLCQVSKHFYNIFAPLLWFRPTYLLLGNPNPLESYNRFVKTVRRARRSVRGYVTILDFRPLRYAEYHDNGSLHRPGISSEAFSVWLRSLTASLPSLKFVITDGLTECILDAIMAFELERNSQSISSRQKPNTVERRDLQQNEVEILESNKAGDLLTWIPEDVFSQLVMLSVAGCPQFDTLSYLNHSTRTNIMYLDISWTKIGASNLSRLSELPHLKILKLRGLRLKSQHLSSMLEEMGTRLFSLDVRNNSMNDDFIQILLAYSFLPNLDQPMSFQNEPTGSLDDISLHSRPAGAEKYMEDAPAYRERADVTEEQETTVMDGRVDMRPDSLDGALSHLLGEEQLKSIQSIHGIPLDSDSFMQPSGITHLFLSDNQFSSDGLRKLLQGTNRLQVLDMGSVYQSRHLLASTNPNIRPISQPDMINLLDLTHSQRLESLRIHHSVVTHTPTLLTVGEFHISESRRIQLSEEQYAVQETTLSPAHLLPDTNPRISSLTLTSIPTKSLGLVITRLLTFLHHASIQESLIAMHRRLGIQTRSGLRILRLEFESPRAPTALASHASISGSADADIFSTESSLDFSFFDHDGSNNQSEPVERDFSFFDHRDEVARSVTSVSNSSVIQGKKSALVGLRDVRDELVAYREGTKAAFERERRRLGVRGDEVPLGAPHYHWTGEVELVS